MVLNSDSNVVLRLTNAVTAAEDEGRSDLVEGFALRVGDSIQDSYGVRKIVVKADKRWLRFDDGSTGPRTGTYITWSAT